MKLSRLATLLFASVLIFSCSKDKEEDNEGFRTTFDGKKLELNLFTRGTLDTVGGIYNLQILATDQDSRGNTLRLGISSENSITSGTYVHNPANDETVLSILFSEAGETTEYEGAFDSTLPFSLTISSISPTRVQGSFEGQVERNSVAKSISGNFNIALQ